MYLTILLSLGLITYLGIKLLQGLRRLLRGERRSNSSGQKENDFNQKKRLEREKDLKASQEKIKKLEKKLSRDVKNQYSIATDKGIVEHICPGNNKILMDSKGLSGAITSQSDLTHLEFENRLQADKNFCGFNLILTEGEKLTLTFHGQALTSLTKIPDSSDMRINIFPPFLEPTMTTKDVDQMFDFLQNANSKGNDALGIYGLMTEAFVKEDNTKKLKQNITPKIQANESKLGLQPSKKHGPKNEVMSIRH